MSLTHLLQAIAESAWMDQAACKGCNPDLWFPGDGSPGGTRGAVADARDAKAKPAPDPEPPTADLDADVERLVALVGHAVVEPSRVVPIGLCDCGHVGRLHSDDGCTRHGCPCDAYTAISSEEAW